MDPQPLSQPSIQCIKEPEKKIQTMNEYSWKIHGTFPQSAMELARQTCELAMDTNNKEGLAFSYLNSGAAFSVMSSYEKALVDLHRAQYLFQKMNLSVAEATVSRSIGNTYYALEDYQKAQACYFLALSKAEETGDKQETACAHGNLARLLAEMDLKKQALGHLEKALRMHESLPNNINSARLTLNIGRAQYMLEETATAAKYFNKALDMSTKENYTWGIACGLTHLAKCHTKQEFYTKAISLHEQALVLARNIEDLALIADIHLNNGITFQKLGDYRTAMDCQKQYNAVKLSIEDRLKKVHKHRVNPPMNAVEEEQIPATRHFAEREPDHSTPLPPNSFALEVNISLAQKAQKAALPSNTDIAKTFSDSFIIYKPLGAVSGDFYWYNKSGCTTVFAVADCTGTGMAGAFMALMGSALLKQIVMYRQVQNPAQILKLLHEKMVVELQKKDKGSTGNQGMDIALCSYNHNSKELKFAGAKRSLYCYRAGVLEIYKSGVVSIGSPLMPKDEFLTHSFHLEDNDKLYLFTNGYTEQFGGADGKRFQSSKFFELVQSVAHKPMQEQKIILQSALQHWMGRHSQQDDVTVVGLQV